MENDSVIDLLPEPRRLVANRGWHWYVNGFKLFRRQPGIWIVIALQFFVLALLANVLPVVGALAYTLVSPVLSGGIYLAAKRCDAGNRVGPLDLFAAFHGEIKPLLWVGFINVLAAMLVTVVLGLFGSQASLVDIPAGSLPTPEQMKSLYLHTSLSLILMTPVMCAVWFAPALILFDGYSAIDAMKLSFAGIARNWQAFLVSGLVTIALCFLSVFTLLLGFLVVLPVMMLMQYIAYREIFAAVPAGADGV
ncbi:BPSS1780 family membrane protein [Iodobacter sp. LRB]|uniref:DUF2189 domain-containing protein n=1 Tax=Iodobacter violaceini TaxID=3044271 RepID=A0ABX0KR13_9NEIS|nr:MULTISPECIES: BPSS1780 family membrane protein [Iodobacter]NHQ87040.1 hypothetical protein [Iodobacter violacea]PHV03245.1 hypothetical protein CSQ88_02910 [Iodobacter sp. BJB302]